MIKKMLRHDVSPIESGMLAQENGQRRKFFMG